MAAMGWPAAEPSVAEPEGTACVRARQPAEDPTR